MYSPQLRMGKIFAWKRRLHHRMLFIQKEAPHITREEAYHIAVFLENERRKALGPAA